MSQRSIYILNKFWVKLACMSSLLGGDEDSFFCCIANNNWFWRAA